jgi:hypothetical protein
MTLRKNIMSIYTSRSCYNGAHILTFPSQNQLHQRQKVAPFTETEYIPNVYTKFEFTTVFAVRSYQKSQKMTNPCSLCALCDICRLCLVVVFYSVLLHISPYISDFISSKNDTSDAYACENESSTSDSKTWQTPITGMWVTPLGPGSSRSVPVQIIECEAAVPWMFDWRTEPVQYFYLFFDLICWTSSIMKSYGWKQEKNAKARLPHFQPWMSSISFWNLHFAHAEEGLISNHA